MRKTLFLLLAVALCVGQIFASPIDVEQARRLGLKYVQSHSARQVANLDLAYTEMAESGTPALYVFNFDNGYIIISADNVAQPILSYGEGENFDAARMPRRNTGRGY